jgi:hypothetical protein
MLLCRFQASGIDVGSGRSGPGTARCEHVLADGLAEHVPGDGPVAGAGEPLGPGPDGGRPAPFGGIRHDGDQGGVTVERLLGGQP